MQTFLPYSDFYFSAKCLDRQRLGKQRVENLQILKALTDPNYGWQNHPAVKMWRGHEEFLYRYQRAICLEWSKRGYKDTCMDKTDDIYKIYYQTFADSSYPWWLGHPLLHESHRSNLIRKMPERYRGELGWTDPDDIPYWWPTEHETYLIGGRLSMSTIMSESNRHLKIGPCKKCGHVKMIFKKTKLCDKCTDQVNDSTDKDNSRTY